MTDSDTTQVKCKICPYLGMRDDPTTAIRYPSDGNYCHREGEPAPIWLEDQAIQCLAGQYEGCPGVRQIEGLDQPVSLSKVIHTGAWYSLKAHPSLWLLIGGVLVTGGYAVIRLLGS